MPSMDCETIHFCTFQWSNLSWLLSFFTQSKGPGRLFGYSRLLKRLEVAETSGASFVCEKMCCQSLWRRVWYHQHLAQGLHSFRVWKCPFWPKHQVFYMLLEWNLFCYHWVSSKGIENQSNSQQGGRLRAPPIWGALTSRYVAARWSSNQIGNLTTTASKILQHSKFKA